MQKLLTGKYGISRASELHIGTTTSYTHLTCWAIII